MRVGLKKARSVSQRVELIYNGAICSYKGAPMTQSLPFQFRQQSYVFTFKMGFSLLCAFFFVLCWALGIWQVQRYYYKKDLLATYQQRLSALPQPFLKLANSQDNLQFQHVVVKGVYINTLTVLLQNRFHDDQVGFEILTPLRIMGEKKLLLVNRGWVPKPRNHIVSKVENVSGEQQIEGYIKTLDAHQFILGKNMLDSNMLPRVMQKIDIHELSQVTQQQFYPFVLRLDASQAHGFVRDWIITVMPPERHMAYAVQWFFMAVVLLLAYLGFCCHKIERNEHAV